MPKTVSVVWCGSPPNAPTPTQVAPRTDAEIPLPAEVESLVHAAHTALVETVVETDDEMLEAYLDGTEPSREKIVETIHHGILDGTIHPVLVTSAERMIGVDFVAEFIVDYGPHPLERPIPRLSAGDTFAPSTDGPGAGLRLQDRLRPLRRADLDVPHLLRHRQGRPGAGAGAWAARFGFTTSSNSRARTTTTSPIYPPAELGPLPSWTT